VIYPVVSVGTKPPLVHVVEAPTQEYCFPVTKSLPSRVRKTGGNRSGSTGSRWNRSGPVHEPVRSPPQNRAYKFASPVNRPVSPVNRPGFYFYGNRSKSGLVNPAPKSTT
jgi:hypothetical protein